MTEEKMFSIPLELLNFHSDWGLMYSWDRVSISEGVLICTESCLQRETHQPSNDSISDLIFSSVPIVTSNQTHSFCFIINKSKVQLILILTLIILRNLLMFQPSGPALRTSRRKRTTTEEDHSEIFLKLGLQGQNDKKNIYFIWKNKFCRNQPSPSPDRRDFRPVNFDGNSLKRSSRRNVRKNMFLFQILIFIF